LTIITNAGGAAVLATDALVLGGGQLATLTPDTVETLNQHLPRYWSHRNPIDILGDATPERYAKTLEVVAQQSETDGLLVILTPQSMTNPTQTARELAAQVQTLQAKTLRSKPVLAAWMGGANIDAGMVLLNQANIPTYPYPDAATQVFNYMWQYSDNLLSLYETPVLPQDCGEDPNCDSTQVELILEAARQANRTLLTETESKQLLAAYGLPVVPTAIATSAEAAQDLANKIGYPVVLKLFSPTITHKTDVGGVHLNLLDAKAVISAYRSIARSVTDKVGAEHFLGVTVQPMIDLQNRYELILGSSIDPQFGPVLLFGLGGQLVEVFRDRAIALPPLNSTLARRMMEQTQIYTALQGIRGRAAVDLAALEQLLVRFSRLVIEQPRIKEIDINPLLASPVDPAAPSSGHSLLVLDARIILHPLETPLTQLPKPAVRPYPSQYVHLWQMKDGRSVTIRPIRPEDEPLVRQFHQVLSEESVYLRYFHSFKLSQRIAHSRLTRLCFIDYDREMALIVDFLNPVTLKHEILAIGRLSKLHGLPEAEFALLVCDDAQNLGLGTELLQRLVTIAQDNQIKKITADILPENPVMQQVCLKVGFQLDRMPGLVRALWQERELILP
jgi:acetyltransferase